MRRSDPVENFFHLIGLILFLAIIFIPDWNPTHTAGSSSEDGERELNVAKVSSVIQVPLPTPVGQERGYNPNLPCPNQGVDKEILAKVIEKLKDNRNRNKVISWNEDYCQHCDYYNVYFVFVDKQANRRYTMWYNPDSINRFELNGKVIESPLTGWLAVWERPNGTSSKKVLETYADIGFDGCVESGADDDLAHLMSWNDKYSSNEGVEHHAYWQGRYNKAILALADVLDVR